LRSRDLNAPSVARDPEMLLLEARVLSARENLPSALQRLDEAIALVSENVNSQLYIRLLLQRAVVRFQLQDYAGSEQDANAVLAKVQTPAAHYYRARGMNWRDWKGTRNDVMADLREALRLEPSYGPALRYLASMTEGTESLDLYRRLATIWPNGAWIYKEIAVLENKRGHNEEALRSIDAAIEIYNENRVFYDVKAEIETSLGRPDAEVQRHQIDGYKQAAASLLKHDKEEATDVYVQLARLLSRFGKRGNQEAFSADLAFVKSKLADLREFYSEFVSGRIQTMNAIDGSKREVVIDRGSDDGLVLGVEGVVRSIYSKTGDHERNFQKIGKARIVSVEPKSARVEVTMDNPAGDGLVRVGDLVEVKAKVPPLPERSVLWGLAKNHITLTSENGDHLFDDFRELYADENEQRVNQQFEGMLSDIRKMADLTVPEMNKKLTQGRFKDQTVRQAAQNATRADLLTFLNFIMKYPAFSGQEWKIGRTFIYWVEQGMPQ
jgi:tetratricopeptide (TPR) repeat protein